MRISDWSSDVCSSELGKAAARPKTHCDCGIEVAARNVANGIGHCQQRQAECERNAEQSDTAARKGCGKHCAAAAAKNEPKCPKKFSDTTLGVRHRKPTYSYQSGRANV